MKPAAQRIAPSLPTAFSSIDGLGAPVAFFRPATRTRLLPLVCAAICALGAAVTLAYGIAATATAYLHYGWATVQALGRIPALVFWLFILAGLIFALYALATWSMAVAVYEQGFASRSPTGIRRVDWGELTALYIAVTRESGLLPRTHHRYTVEHGSSERISFDDRLEDVVALGAMLGHQIVERIYPAAAGRFNTGEAVVFGPVSIDQRGIQLKDRLVPWDEVEFVSLRRGYLLAQPKAGASTGLPAASIPNLDVLLLLLDHVTDIRLEE